MALSSLGEIQKGDGDSAAAQERLASDVMCINSTMAAFAAAKASGAVITLGHELWSGNKIQMQEHLARRIP